VRRQHADPRPSAVDVEILGQQRARGSFGAQPLSDRAAGLADAAEDEGLSQRDGPGAVQGDSDVAVDNGSGSDDERFGAPYEITAIGNLYGHAPTSRPASHVEGHRAGRFDDLEPHGGADSHTDRHVVSGDEKRTLRHQGDPDMGRTGLEDADAQVSAAARAVAADPNAHPAAGLVADDVEFGVAHGRRAGSWS
jgi:hypothetical protein